MGCYFNSRPHGGRRWSHPVFSCSLPFQLTPSRRATRFSHKSSRLRGLFQLTPSRRATVGNINNDRRSIISTHALTEGDATLEFEDMDLAFQLTPSRRATIAGVYGMFSVRNFNSRPHGGRHGLMLSGFSACLFQLTPSRRATTYVAAVLSMSIFQLTPSRRATFRLSHALRFLSISTHALTEGDGSSQPPFLS